MTMTYILEPTMPHFAPYSRTRVTLVILYLQQRISSIGMILFGWTPEVLASHTNYPTQYNIEFNKLQISSIVLQQKRYVGIAVS